MKENKLKIYMKQAEVISKLSPDSQTKVGALLVDSDNFVILSTYNGYISGAPDNTLPSTRPDKYSYILHAEQNLLCLAAKKGISTENCVVICTLSPCCHCTRLMWQSGIRKVYFKDKYKDFNKNYNMKDIKINLNKIGEYYIMEMEVG